jgi:outer membrane protein TolC
LEQSAAAQALALHLAQERYAKGLTAYLDVLEAERALQQAQIEQAEGQAYQSEQLVALYKALGGGWKAAEPEKMPPGAWPERVEQLLERR